MTFKVQGYAHLTHVALSPFSNHKSSEKRAAVTDERNDSC